VKPADTPAVPNEMETPQTHEEEGAREEPPIQMDRRTRDPTRNSEVTGSSSPLPVQLECSQRSRAPPSYLEDFLCDAVDKPLAVIAKEVREDQQLRVTCPVGVKNYFNWGNNEGRASFLVKGGIM